MLSLAAVTAAFPHALTLRHRPVHVGFGGERYSLPVAMSITSDELNFLVYRYLHESGAHRAPWCKICEMASAQTASHERRHTHDHPPPPRSVHRHTALLTRALRLQVSGTPPSLSALRAWSPRATSTAPRSRRAS